MTDIPNLLEALFPHPEHTCTDVWKLRSYTKALCAVDFSTVTVDAYCRIFTPVTVKFPPIRSEYVLNMVNSMVKSALKKSYRDWTIFIEYAMLCDRIVDSTVVLPHQNMQWCGIVLPPSGPYSDLSVRFTLSFPEDYPDSAPLVHFVPPLPHPAVDQESGVLHLQTAFSEWDLNQHCALQVLAYIRRLFHSSDLVAEVGSVSALEDLKSSQTANCQEKGCLMQLPIASISLGDEEWLERLVREALQTLESHLDSSSLRRSVPVRSHVEGWEIVDNLVDDLWHQFLVKYSIEKDK